MLKKTHKIFYSTLAHHIFCGVVSAIFYLYISRLGITENLDIKQLDDLWASVKSFASTAAQIASTLIGFILAAITILLTLSGHKLIVNMGISGHLRHLVIRMLMSMLALMAFMIYSMSVMVSTSINECILYTLSSLSVYAMLVFMDLVIKLGLVLYFLSPLPQANDKVVSKTYYEE
jgi:hypothetical protein